MTRADELRALWVPDDFPCKANFGRLVNGVIHCGDCGQPMDKMGDGWFHPGTPAHKAALDKMQEGS